MRFRTSAVAFCCAAIAADTASSQTANDGLQALFNARKIPVTLDNFVRAATDIEMGKYLALSGGVNRVFHGRQPTPVPAVEPFQ